MKGRGENIKLASIFFGFLIVVGGMAFYAPIRECGQKWHGTSVPASYRDGHCKVQINGIWYPDSVLTSVPPKT